MKDPSVVVVIMLDRHCHRLIYGWLHGLILLYITSHTIHSSGCSSSSSATIHYTLHHTVYARMDILLYKGQLVWR